MLGTYTRLTIQDAAAITSQYASRNIILNLTHPSICLSLYPADVQHLII